MPIEYSPAQIRKIIRDTVKSQKATEKMLKTLMGQFRGKRYSTGCNCDTLYMNKSRCARVLEVFIENGVVMCKMCVLHKVDKARGYTGKELVNTPRARYFCPANDLTEWKEV